MGRKRHSESGETRAEEAGESKAEQRREARAGTERPFANGGLVAGRTSTSKSATSNPQPPHARQDHKMTASMRSSLKGYPRI